MNYPVLGEITPLSFNDFTQTYELPEDQQIAAFSIYCMGYWIQQNPDKFNDEGYQERKAKYEDCAIRPV